MKFTNTNSRKKNELNFHLSHYLYNEVVGAVEWEVADQLLEEIHSELFPIEYLLVCSFMVQ